MSPSRTSTLSLLSIIFLCFAGLSPKLLADHGGTTATTVDELLEQYLDRLNEVADEFGFEPGDQPNFDEARFNRLVGKARVTMDRGIGLIERGLVCSGMRQLTRTTRLLEAATDFAIAQNMSGSGYSDDLASFLSGITEFFVEDLITIVSEDESAPEWVLDWAQAAYERGKELRSVNVDEWSASMRAFSFATCLVFWSL